MCRRIGIGCRGISWAAGYGLGVVAGELAGPKGYYQTL